MPDTEQLDLLKDEPVIVKLDADAGPGGDKDPVKDLVAQNKELQEKAAEQTKQREDAERREAAARQEAATARAEAVNARGAANNSNLDTLTTAIEAAKAAVEAAKRDMRAAKEAQDLDAETDAQDRLTSARVDLRTYDEAKAALETRIKAQPRVTAPTDPVEAYVQNRTEQTANWLRAHRDYITDPKKNNKLTAAHHDAVAEGYSPDTKEYFDHVETFIGIRKAEVTDGDNVQRPGAAAVKKPAARVAAPVSNGGGSGGGDGNEVHLTQGEAKSAQDGTIIWNYDDPSGKKLFKKGDPIGVQEMARRKRAMKQSGQYDRTYETQ